MRVVGRGRGSSWNPTGTLGRKWTFVAVAAIALVPILDHFVPRNVHLAHALVVPVALTAVFFGPRRTAAIGTLAIAALAVAGAERMALGTESVLVELASLAVLSLLLVLVSGLLERRGRELAGLRHVSEAVLPPLPPRVGPVSIASVYRAADADTPVGGDLYAVARTADATRVLIGDVRGKGVASIRDTETVLGAFRAAAHRQAPLPELVAQMEGSVRWGLGGYDGGAVPADAAEHFVTAAIVEIPDGEPCLRMVSCGHLPLLLFHDGTVRALSARYPAPPLGLGELAEDGYTPTAFPFAPGDRLLLYTDGVTEARDGKGAFYPLLERAAGWTDRDPDGLVEVLTRELERYTGSGLTDDMAAVAVRRDAAPAPASGAG